MRHIQIVARLREVGDLGASQEEEGVLGRDEEVARDQLDLGVLLALVELKLLLQHLVKGLELFVNAKVRLLEAFRL